MKKRRVFFDVMTIEKHYKAVTDAVQIIDKYRNGGKK